MMEQGELELACPHEIEEADFGEGPQRRRQQPGTHVDHVHLHLAGGQVVDHLHLVRGRRQVDDLRDRRMEPLESSAWKFGIERARQGIPRGEIIEHRPRNRGLADAALVGADHENHWLH